MESNRRMTELAAKVMANEIKRRRPTYVAGQWLKINDETVKAVRDATGTNAEISARFGITRQYVYQLRLNKFRRISSASDLMK